MAKKKQPKKLLAHHRHTGKVLAHHHTSWPFVALLLLMLGVLLTQVTFQARAADVSISAAINGPLPPEPAVIQSPEKGEHFTDIPVTVRGTCPALYFVKVYRNQTFSGATQCQNDGTFSLSIDLFEGQNELEARIYNAADQEGPRSDSVAVTYGLPVPEFAQPQATTPTSPEKPFFLTTDKFFKANLNRPKMTWTFGIVGGDKPFKADVDWGDGTTTNLSDIMAAKFTASHVYKKSTSTRDYYPVTVKVNDVDNDQATLQVFNILNYSVPPAVAGPGNTTSPNSPVPPAAISNGIFQQIKYAWPAYGAVTLMATSFWLGQQGTLVHVASQAWTHKLRFPRFKL